MYSKSVLWLSVGDELADDVIVENTVIYKKGTLLSFYDIMNLVYLGVLYVNVQTEPLNTTETSPPIIFKNLTDNRLEYIFREHLLSEEFSNGRYHKIIQSNSDYQFLLDLFLKILSDEKIESILSALKIWDFSTYSHSIDTFILGTLWLKYINAKNIKETATGYLLHDIGKIHIPRDILQKSNRLTKMEYEIIKSHVHFGEHLLKKLGYTNLICDLAMYHHKWHDNKGYPTSITNINSFSYSLELNMLLILDMFSALTLDRPYRKAFTSLQAMDIMNEDREKYDSDLLDQFFIFMRNHLW